MNALRYWLLLVAIVGTSYGMSIVWRNRPQPQERLPTSTTESVPLRPDEPLPPFTLTDQDGRPFDSASLKGRVWVASFFFTNCPAICWKLNLALMELQAAAPESDIHYVSITCDPENDTPVALQKYANHFKADPARWAFLTGALADLRSVGRGFQVALDKGLHSDRAFVVDRQGRVRGNFRLTEPDDVVRMKKLIAKVEGESPP